MRVLNLTYYTQVCCSKAGFLARFRTLVPSVYRYSRVVTHRQANFFPSRVLGTKLHGNTFRSIPRISVDTLLLLLYFVRSCVKSVHFIVNVKLTTVLLCSHSVAVYSRVLIIRTNSVRINRGFFRVPIQMTKKLCPITFIY